MLQLKYEQNQREILVQEEAAHEELMKNEDQEICIDLSVAKLHKKGPSLHGRRLRCLHLGTQARARRVPAAGSLQALEAGR